MLLLQYKNDLALAVERSHLYSQLTRCGFNSPQVGLGV